MGKLEFLENQYIRKQRLRAEWQTRLWARGIKFAVDLPPWIVEGRQRIGQLLAVQGACFDRTLTALAVYHRMRIR